MAIALKQRVDLRGDDTPPAKDAWETLRREAGDKWDPIAAAGIKAARPMLGTAFDVELRRRADEEIAQRQASQWAVRAGASITFPSGKVATEGQPITLEDIAAGEHSREVMRALVGRRIVSQIDAQTAWLRTLPPSVGPYVACETFELDGKRFERGQSVDRDDFPEPPRPRQFAPEDRVADMTVAELEECITARLASVGLLQPRRAPRLSPFAIAKEAGRIASAPNYQPQKRGFLGRLTGADRK